MDPTWPLSAKSVGIIGFVIAQNLIPNASDGMSVGIRDLFMYPQQAFFKEVNKVASCMFITNNIFRINLKAPNCRGVQTIIAKL